MFVMRKIVPSLKGCSVRKEINEWICVKKKANGLYFYKGHNEVKIGL